MITRRKYILTLAGYAIPVILLMLVSPFFGAEKLCAEKVINGIFYSGNSIQSEIFVFHRLPRVILAFLVGGGLAVSGGALQIVLKNPLAEPFILGIASSGAVGAVIAISVPWLSFSVGPFSSVSFFSLSGSLLCVGGIYYLTVYGNNISMNTILLAGVTFNILCGASIMLIRYLVSPHLLVSMDRWLMGGLDVLGFSGLLSMLPFFLSGLALIFFMSKGLNQLAMGEEMAMGHGVDVQRLRMMVFLGTGLLTAAAVSLAGPVGFVGLIIPHGVRKLSGSDARMVLSACFFAGGGFLILCDIAARTIVAPTEMPVGIITALIGGPVFLRILFKGQKS